MLSTAVSVVLAFEMGVGGGRWGQKLTGTALTKDPKMQATSRAEISVRTKICSVVTSRDSFGP
jgi:hypothetical protein